jgi:hypothetical protein
LQLQLWPIANCQLLFALFSKIFAHRTLERWQILGDFLERIKYEIGQ